MIAPPGGDGKGFGGGASAAGLRRRLRRASGDHGYVNEIIMLPKFGQVRA
jgi:hypothetical protein